MTVLEDFGRLTGNIFLGGHHRKSLATEALDVIDPATEHKLGEVAETTEAEIDEAIAIGHAAQKKWWAISGLERSEIMHEVANRMHHMRPRLAEAMTREMGKPYKESADEVEWSVSAIRYNAEVGRSDAGGHGQRNPRTPELHPQTTIGRCCEHTDLQLSSDFVGVAVRSSTGC